MKIKSLTIVLLVFFLSLQYIFGAETITISSPVTTDVCNAKEYEYSATTSGLNPNKSYYVNWIVGTGTYTNGTISGVKVTWGATTSSNTGTLKVELKDAANNSVVATSSELSFTIKSIKHIKAQLPMFGGGGGVYTLSPCDAGTLYLSAADIQVPGTGNPPQEVFNWKWLVPSGWTVDGQTSNGSTVILGNQNVTVTYPASPTEGSIKVQGYHVVNGCTADTQESLPSDAVSVKREVAFTFSANKSYLLCGDTNPVTFTVSPAPACAVYYWNNSQTPTTSNSFQLTPDGSSPAIATVNIVYGGKTKTMSKTINYQLFAPGVVPQIQGSGIICSSNQSYTVTDLRPGYTVSWNCSSNLTRISSQVSYPGVFNQNASGLGWIEAIVLSACGNSQAIRFEVWAGSPTIDYISGPQYVSQAGNCESYFITHGNANATYQWWVVPTWGTIPCTINSYGNSANICFPEDGDYRVYAKATNDCGESTAELFVSVGIYEPYIIYPNPGDDNITLQISETGTTLSSSYAKEKLKKSDSYEVKILNEQGTLMKAHQTKQLPLNIQTHSLPNGKYIIQVVTNGKTWNKQLLIKH